MGRSPLHRHGSGASFRSGSSSRLGVVLVTFVVTIALDSLLRGPFWRPLEHVNSTQVSSLRLSEGEAAEGAEVHAAETQAEAAADQSVHADGVPLQTTPTWELPEELRSSLVVALPMSPASEGWVQVSREWRKGVRAVLVADFAPTPAQLSDSLAHGETYAFANASAIPYSFFGKAAMTPSLAHDALGGGGYEWMLYGDDDTIWHLDAVADIVRGLDPAVPHFITDHFWFWGYGDGTPPHPEHPSPAAPRCAPCGANVSALATVGPGTPTGFVPPEACGEGCTWRKLCEADGGRRPELYRPDCSGFRPRYPPQGELIAHGGAGIILSVGLMRRLTTPYMLDCIRGNFSHIRVPGGDTLFSHCAFFTGVAPTDPGYFFRDTSFNAFDQGGQLVRQSIDLAYHSLKRSCCSALCQARLRAATTVHMRSAHFKEPQVAMDMARQVIKMRDMYRYVQSMATVHTDHEQVPMTWDVHKICY